MFCGVRKEFYLCTMIRLTVKKPQSVEDLNIVSLVEQSVCSVLDVDIRLIGSKNMKSNVTLARGFIAYILHIDYGFSIGVIAMLYNRSRRNIFWHNDKIKHYIRQKTYKVLYDEMKSKIQQKG